MQGSFLPSTDTLGRTCTFRKAYLSDKSSTSIAKRIHRKFSRPSNFGEITLIIYGWIIVDAYQNIYIMMMGTGNLSGVVYPGFIIAITNIAPHLKGISISSSARLLRLFRAFSDPAFLLADEGNPRLLFFL
jgi:hypothetical protein